MQIHGHQPARCLASLKKELWHRTWVTMQVIAGAPCAATICNDVRLRHIRPRSSMRALSEHQPSRVNMSLLCICMSLTVSARSPGSEALLLLAPAPRPLAICCPALQRSRGAACGLRCDFGLGDDPPPRPGRCRPLRPRGAVSGEQCLSAAVQSGRWLQVGGRGAFRTAETGVRGCAGCPVT